MLGIGVADLLYAVLIVVSVLNFIQILRLNHSKLKLSDRIQNVENFLLGIETRNGMLSNLEMGDLESSELQVIDKFMARGATCTVCGETCSYNDYVTPTLSCGCSHTLRRTPIK